MSEACAQCGYDTTQTQVGDPCPECGSLERRSPVARSLVEWPGVRRVLIVQGVGGLCCLGASLLVLFSSSNEVAGPIAIVLTGVGAIMCLLVGPGVAMQWFYTESILANRPPKHLRGWATVLVVLASGIAALVTGILMGIAACSVGWIGIGH